MLLNSVLGYLKGRLTRQRTTRRGRGPARRRPLLEVLEDRDVPSFLAPVGYGVGSLPSAVVVADFNGDGRSDLAVANTGSQTVSVLLGNGDGSFQAAANSVAGMWPESLAAGDFNGDGRPDLAVAGSSNTVSVLLGNGDGTFQDPRDLSIGPSWVSPLAVAVGDFNGDGRADLGAKSISYDGYCSQDRSYSDLYTAYVSVLLGNGDGTFSAPSILELGRESTDVESGPAASLVVGDLNSDGELDLATPLHQGYSVCAGADAVGVLLGNGDGTLQLPRFHDAGDGYGLHSVAVGDFNADGKSDLVTGNWGDLSLLLGNGDGSFQPAQSFGGDLRPGPVAVGDVNRDGKLDVAVTSASGNEVLILFGMGDGTFLAPQGYAAGPEPTSLAVGDFNADGFPDLAVTNASAATASVLLNAADWSTPPGVPSVIISDAAVTEGNSGTTAAVFTVTLSAAYSQTVTLDFSTADGAATVADGDYQAASGTLTFAPGETSRTITVLVNGDRRGEHYETFLVNLTNVSNAILTDAQAVGTIRDDEPRMSISDASVKEGSRGKKLMTFTVTLSAAYDAPVTVRYATRDGTATAADNDYVAASGTLTFAPGETSKTITIEILGDTRKEADEYFLVNLSGAEGALLLDSDGRGTILDDDNKRK